ncbi:MAG: urate hydroxylase PuuD [Spirochaetales bacterium]|nr:urate hydroxylase PuuD [Spirochaetales bacterium]
MEAHLFEWLNLSLRWLHMIAGIAWIGASFYFVWLNNHVEDHPENKSDVEGSLWAIHGGAFYYVEKFKVAPPRLPERLHWFKWEAYTTWITGFSLLVLLYFWKADLYLIDRQVFDLLPWQAVTASLVILAAGWLFYDLLCRSPLGKSNLATGAGLSLLTALVIVVTTQIFSGRGAFMITASMLGTIMVANVFFVIIPGQWELVRAAQENRSPDPEPGRRAAQRSFHNSYITLPVLFAMISNHFPVTYQNECNYIIFIGIALSGALIRHWFIQRHRGEDRFYLWILVALIFAALFFLTLPESKSGGAPVSYKLQIEPLIQKHCLSCHSHTPRDPAYKTAPNGTAYDRPEDVARMAAKIAIFAVQSQAMPLANRTGMTKEERELLGRWIDQGAALD